MFYGLVLSWSNPVKGEEDDDLMTSNDSLVNLFLFANSSKLLKLYQAALPFL